MRKESLCSFFLRELTGVGYDDFFKFFLFFLYLAAGTGTQSAAAGCARFVFVCVLFTHTRVSVY